MDYLYERQRAVDSGLQDGSICATGKHVIVIGGGDTGADCVANATREGAASVVQLELLARAAAAPARTTRRRGRCGRRSSASATRWRRRARSARASRASRSSRRISSPARTVASARCTTPTPRDAPPFGPVEGTEDSMPAQLVLLAMGFLHPEQALVDGLGLAKDARSNIAAPVYETSQAGIFAAGDARRGQSLIVWAINEGRQAARMADRHLRSLAPAPVESGNVHDADFGPEGPPQHVNGALVAEE
jgi:glutamate synthase (NADPH/NADH) small chain